MILASGGFGADFTQDSLLAQYRPDLMHLPTTSGEHCTGDGIKMGETIGGMSTIITPVIHYYMGGLEIDCDSAVHDDEACTTRTWHCMRQWLLWL